MAKLIRLAGFASAVMLSVVYADLLIAIKQVIFYKYTPFQAAQDIYKQIVVAALVVIVYMDLVTR